MAFIDFKFFSEILGMQSSVYVVIPQRSSVGEIGLEKAQPKPDMKVLYLLHGLSDDHTIWLRRTCIERYAEQYGVCVVMPNCHKSFYTDMKHGGNYYTYITKELPLRMREFFRVSDKYEDTYIAGLSMGGYGALKCGLREPQQYRACAGLSSVTQIRRFYNWRPEIARDITGGEVAPDCEDLYSLCDLHKDDKIKPRVFIGVGRQDMLYPENVDFKKKLEDCGYDLTYRESDGTHSWSFWDEYIQYVIKWMFEDKKD